MTCDKNRMRLYAVTDQTWTGKQTLCEQVEAALKGGVTCVQLREKELSEKEFIEEAIAIRKICQFHQVPLIINDNVNVALHSGADGIHIGQTDMKIMDVRRILGENKIIGVSAHSVEEAIEAVRNGADYLGVGAVFTTSTKLDATALSYETLRDICHSVTIPVVAIGGIHKENILKLSGSGIDGVALVSAIFSARDIERECKELSRTIHNMITNEYGRSLHK